MTKANEDRVIDLLERFVTATERIALAMEKANYPAKYTLRLTQDLTNEFGETIFRHTGRIPQPSDPNNPFLD